MAKILILGAGSMGTAFSFPCVDNNHFVSIIGTHLEDDFIEKINLNRIHPALNLEVDKNVSFFKFDKFEEEINKKIDLIVIAVSSNGVKWAAEQLSKVLKNKIPILVLTKGLSVNKNEYEVLAKKIERILNNNNINGANISAAGGPCLAKSLAERVHTSVVFANNDIKFANYLSKLVSTNYYHVFTSNDVVGVEVCAAIKNIFSMVIGASQGLCKSNSSSKVSETSHLNTAASLIQQSISEMIIFTEKVQGKKDTVLGLAGIGDLYVSADGGRNSKMGFYIGQGLSFLEAKKMKMPNVTIEAAELINEIGSKVKSDFNIKELPLMIAMIDTVLNKDKLIINWEDFKL